MEPSTAYEYLRHRNWISFIYSRNGNDKRDLIHPTPTPYLYLLYKSAFFFIEPFILWLSDRPLKDRLQSALVWKVPDHHSFRARPKVSTRNRSRSTFLLISLLYLPSRVSWACVCGSRASPAWSWCPTRRSSSCASPRSPPSPSTRPQSTPGSCELFSTVSKKTIIYAIRARWRVTEKDEFFYISHHIYGETFS